MVQLHSLHVASSAQVHAAATEEHDSSLVSVQVVLEGKLVNLDVTSPAATLALGLMFLRTNDAAIAAAFTLPDTHFALDYVRPDFVMLRILARSLVMQDSVQASQAWVEAQMPPLIKVMRDAWVVCLSARGCASKPGMGQSTDAASDQGMAPCLSCLSVCKILLALLTHHIQ